MWLGTFLVLCALVLLLPFLPAGREWFFQQDARPLWRVSTNENIRYFSTQFKSLADRELSLAFVDESFLVVDANNNTKLWHAPKPVKVSKRLYAPQDLSLPDAIQCQGEIYGKGNVYVGESALIRAVLAEQDLELDDYCTVTRWLQARNVRIGDHCKILGRITANHKIEIQPSCDFQRVSAEEIEFGLLDRGKKYAHSEEKTEDWQVQTEGLTEFVISGQDSRRIIINEDFLIPDHALLKSDLIVKGKLEIGKGSVILGDIKAYDDIVIRDHASIKGATVSQTSILVREWCRIAGPLIAEDGVKLGFGSIVGSRKTPATISCSRFQADYGVVVYGAINKR